VVSQTLRANSKPFSACRASPSATSAKNGIRSGGRRGIGLANEESALVRIVSRDAGVWAERVNTLLIRDVS
jgi:hypothetical protein